MPTIMYLENCCCYVVNLLFKTCDLERIQSIKNNFTGKFCVSQDFLSGEKGKWNLSWLFSYFWVDGDEPQVGSKNGKMNGLEENGKNGV